MEGNTMGVDPNKVQIVTSCLEASFKDVRSDKLHECFVFNDGKESGKLVLLRAFIDDIPLERLKTFMETKILPELKANPGKKLSVSTGWITIGNKQSH